MKVKKMVIWTAVAVLFSVAVIAGAFWGSSLPEKERVDKTGNAEIADELSLENLEDNQNPESLKGDKLSAGTGKTGGLGIIAYKANDNLKNIGSYDGDGSGKGKGGGKDNVPVKEELPLSQRPSGENTAQPTEPEKPAEPEKPIEPERPTEPDKPTKPTQESMEESESNPQKEEIIYNPQAQEFTAELVLKAEDKEVVMKMPQGVTAIGAGFLNALKGSSKKLIVQSGGAEWKIYLSTIEKTACDIDLMVTVPDAALNEQVEAGMKHCLNTEENVSYLPWSFAHEGVLPFTARLTIDAGSEWKNTEVSLYETQDEETLWLIKRVESDGSGKFSYLLNSCDSSFGAATSDITGEYQMVWHDEFDGDTLNTDDWNREKRQPGWTNNELQEYTDSDDNVYLDGEGNLVIQAVEMVKDGNNYYTSGKVTTQHKEIFKYGKVEIRAKMPRGQGLWPALWMMPENESYYGQWPKCGEIDIVELLGHEPDKIYGTIHYGVPHKESQGTYILEGENYSDDFHVFSMEWEPGELRFYMDGNLYHTVNDWYTKVEGGNAVSYPAPFDQAFFLQMNLAVGGDWPGNPDNTTDFEDAKMIVDYVRVYQRDSYYENVLEPLDEPAGYRDADDEGNYIINGDFASESGDVADKGVWEFLTANGGEGNAAIIGEKMVINTKTEGNVDYSIQLVQAGVPMEKGREYVLSFDAWADEERTMITDISAPDRSWIRYFNDTSVLLGTKQQHYEFTFYMTDESDANGRLEFNLGNQESRASVYLDNISLKKTGNTLEEEEEGKTVRSDGNYVYNGSFQEGKGRMGYWEVISQIPSAKAAVTSDTEKKLKISVPEGDYDLTDLILAQTELALNAGKEYVMSFDISADREKEIQICLGRDTFTVSADTGKQTVKKAFTLSETEDDRYDLTFLLGTEGEIYLDNVRISDSGLLVNGDFSNGMIGWTAYVNSSYASMVSNVVNTLTEDSAAEYTISNAADMQEWDIQLKQDGVTLEQGKYYQIKFEAKSSINRRLQFAFQRDGSGDDDWSPYSSGQKVMLSNEYQTFTEIFKMEKATDDQAIFTFSMGNMEGVTNEEHKIWIDNVVLEELPEDTRPGEEKDNLLINGDFSANGEGWNGFVFENAALNEETPVFADGKAVFDILSTGTAEWHVILKQENITGLLAAKGYEFSVTLSSDVPRTIKAGFFDSSENWVGGADIVVTRPDEMVTYIPDTYWGEGKTFADVSTVQISMGRVDDSTPATGYIVFDEICLKESGSSAEITPNVSGENLLNNPEFTDNALIGWLSEGGIFSAADGKVKVQISSVGSNDYSVQLKQEGLQLEKGKWYKASFIVTSSVDRKISLKLQENGGSWTVYNNGGTFFDLHAGTNQLCEAVFQMASDTTGNALYGIMLGRVDSDTLLSEHTIEISGVSLVQYDGEPTD